MAVRDDDENYVREKWNPEIEAATTLILSNMNGQLVYYDSIHKKLLNKITQLDNKIKELEDGIDSLHKELDQYTQY